MRLFRTLLILLSVGTFALGTAACGGGSDNPEASTTTGVGPQEVEEPGNPSSPQPGTEQPSGGNQDDPGAGVGGQQSNP